MEILPYEWEYRVERGQYCCPTYSNTKFVFEYVGQQAPLMGTILRLRSVESFLTPLVPLCDAGVAYRELSRQRFPPTR